MIRGAAALRHLRRREPNSYTAGLCSLVPCEASVSKQDTHFINMFSLVIGILVAFAVVLFVVARFIGASTQGKQMASDPDYYKTSPRQDPPGPVAGTSRVARGGAWNSGLGECRAAHRMERPPTHRSIGFGFRVVLMH